MNPVEWCRKNDVWYLKIDLDIPEIIIKEAQALDVLVVQGDASVRDDLIEAEIEKAEVYIAATERDEINILSWYLIFPSRRVNPVNPIFIFYILIY